MVNIWVEGIADQKFVADLILVWFEKSNLEKKNKEIWVGNLNEEPIAIVRVPNVKQKPETRGGDSFFTSKNGFEYIKIDFVQNYDREVKNIILMDIDDHDFEQRRKTVEETITEVGFDHKTDLYLWPENQEGKQGNLETLLEQVVAEEHKGILACFENYETCLSEKNATYNTPNKKAKIYAYAECLGVNGKEENRDYSQSEHWNIKPDEQPILKSLYEFLKRHIA